MRSNLSTVPEIRRFFWYYVNKKLYYVLLRLGGKSRRESSLWFRVPNRVYIKMQRHRNIIRRKGNSRQSKPWRNKNHQRWRYCDLDDFTLDVRAMKHDGHRIDILLDATKEHETNLSEFYIYIHSMSKLKHDFNATGI